MEDTFINRFKTYIVTWKSESFNLKLPSTFTDRSPKIKKAQSGRVAVS